jgi:hypothetical protein
MFSGEAVCTGSQGPVCTGLRVHGVSGPVRTGSAAAEEQLEIRGKIAKFGGNSWWERWGRVGKV